MDDQRLELLDPAQPGVQQHPAVTAMIPTSLINGGSCPHDSGLTGGAGHRARSALWVTAEGPQPCGSLAPGCQGGSVEQSTRWRGRPSGARQNAGQPQRTHGAAVAAAVQGGSSSLLSAANPGSGGCG
ncbi:MAG: hypothetical protein ACRDYA_03030 [Egibacteraceae bacterium]